MTEKSRLHRGAQGNSGPRKTLEKINDRSYNKSGDSPACQRKEVSVNMADRYTVKGSLCNDNGTWTVRGRVYDPAAGKVRQRSRSTGLKVKDSTKRKAEQAMRDIVANWEKEANAGALYRSDLTFGECVERWLAAKELDLKRNTLQSYYVSANAYIIPALGEIKLVDMTRQRIQQYFESLKDRVSANTMKKHKVIINGVIRSAVVDGLIPADISDLIKLPKVSRFEGNILTEAQLGQFLEAVKREGEPVRCAVLLAVSYGLRRSEICGLRWSDVDFDSGLLRIRNTVTEYSGKVLEAETTKTKASRRDIGLVEDTVPYLRSLRALQAAHGLHTDKVCVFADGREVKPEWLTRAIKHTLEKYGFPHIRLHDLRHTAATMLARRLPVKYVQAFLGHEDVHTTLEIYTHVLDEDKRRTSQTMNGILRNVGFCSEKCSEAEIQGGSTAEVVRTT